MVLLRLRSSRCIVVLAYSLVSSLSTAVSSFQLQPSVNIMSSSSRLQHQSSSSALSAAKSRTQFITNKRCPFAQKAWIALGSIDCAYDMREVSLYGAGGKPDWFWKLNPDGTVPIVVVTDEKSGAENVFADSELILDAVDDGRVVGGTDGILYMSSELSDEEKSKIDQWRSMISKQLVPVGKSAVLGGSESKLRSLLKEMNDIVEGPYLVGDSMTTADCCAFPFLWRVDNEFGIGGSGEEKLRAWLDKCMDTESIKRTIPAQGWWWWW